MHSNLTSYLPDGPHTTPSRAKSLPIGTERATLTVLLGLKAGRMMTLKDAPLVIGSMESVDLRVDDPAVARQHARIAREPDGRFFIEDLGSTNGTFVSARRVDRAPLASGDVVQIGPALLLRFAVVRDAEASLGNGG